VKPNRAARRAKQRAWEAKYNHGRVRIITTVAEENRRALEAGLPYAPFVVFDRGDGQGFTDKPLEVGEWPRALLTVKEEF